MTGKCFVRRSDLEDRARRASGVQEPAIGGVALAHGERRRILAAAAVVGVGAAGGEAAARRAGPRAAGGWPLDRGEPLDVLVHAGHRAQQGLRVGMRRMVEDARAPAPLSTIRPAYITTTRSHILATMPKSWVMKISARFVSSWMLAQQPQVLGLDGHVERGRRLVGDEDARLGRRWRWRRRRAASCRR